jgi:hypothetical protein
MDETQVLFRKFFPIDGETVKTGYGRFRIPYRVKYGMPCEDPPGNLLRGEHILCPCISQIPVK